MAEHRAAVASGHPRVSAAAAAILRAGGNAFDAVVAAGFAAAVAEPALTSLGGGGFLLARSADGAVTVFDFFVDTPGRALGETVPEPHFLPVTVRFPASTQVFNIGLGSIAVPGNLAGFLHAHARLGRLLLDDVLAPAVALARDGLTLNRQQAYCLGLLEPIMTLTPSGRTLFAPRGQLLAAGEQFVNPELANFMQALPAAGEAFYRGVLAGHMANDMRRGQGLLGLPDLAAYQVIERQPLVIDYRGYRLLTNPPPSFGGTLIALSLQLLAAAELEGLAFGEARHLQALAAALLEVDRNRIACLAATLTSGTLASSLERVRLASGGTTHVSVCDAEGNVASMTTSNGEGSGYLAPETGIMLNNMMGEDDLHPDGFHSAPAGQRVASMMSPALLMRGDEPCLVLGSGGSKRIRTALLQVISNTVDFGMAPGAAVEAPRLHWDGEHLQSEPGFSDAVLTALEQHWPLNRWAVRDMYFGGVHMVTPWGSAAGDSRRGGHALVLD